MLLPVGKRLLVKRMEAKPVTIIITSQQPTQFIVICRGDEVTKVQPGDVIFLEKSWAVEIEYEGEKYLLVDEGSILVKVYQPDPIDLD